MTSTVDSASYAAKLDERAGLLLSELEDLEDDWLTEDEDAAEDDSRDGLHDALFADPFSLNEF